MPVALKAPRTLPGQGRTPAPARPLTPLAWPERQLVEMYLHHFPRPGMYLHHARPDLFDTLYGWGYDVDEINQVCVVGVCRAAKKFRGDQIAGYTGRPVAFNSYANFWVIAQAREQVRTEGRQHCPPGVGEVRGDKIMAHAMPNGGPVKGWDLIEAPPDLARDPAEHEGNAYLGARVRQALRHLPPRAAYVMILRFGLDGGPAHTLAEVGEILDLTRERVRQIEHRARRTLAAHLGDLG